MNLNKRSLPTVRSKIDYLAEILSSEHAIWTLCSIILPRYSDAKLRAMDIPLTEAFQMIDVNAHVVYVDIDLPHGKMLFKLSNETIEALIGFHKSVHLVDEEASISSWSEKKARLNELEENFVRAVNNLMFRTSTEALEELDGMGTGMLSSHESEIIKAAILDLFLPKCHFRTDGYHPMQGRLESWNFEPSEMSESLDFQPNFSDVTMVNSMANVKLNSGYDSMSGDAAIIPSSLQTFLPPSICYIYSDALQLEWPSVFAERMEEVNGALSRFQHT